MKYLLISLLICCLPAFSLGKDFCRIGQESGNKGDIAYQKKEYKLAIRHYNKAIYSLDYCYSKSDFAEGGFYSVTSTYDPKAYKTTLFNSIALAYLRIDRPLTANAYLKSSDVTDSKTSFNQVLVDQSLAKKTTPDETQCRTGLYLRHVGFNIWNHLTISEERGKCTFAYDGYRATNPEMGGVNIGDLQGFLTFKENKGYFASKTVDDIGFNYDCALIVSFGHHMIEVEETRSDCGYGFGVYTGGIYWKVEAALIGENELGY